MLPLIYYDSLDYGLFVQLDNFFLFIVYDLSKGQRPSYKEEAPYTPQKSFQIMIKVNMLVREGGGLRVLGMEAV